MRVLVAEDAPVSRRLLEVMLTKWGYEVTVASDGPQAWELLQEEGSPRLAVLDRSLPGLAGPEVCRRLRARHDGPYLYLILLGAKGGSEDLLTGLQAGADDYLTKPFDPPELKLRVRAGERILNLQAELLTAQEALQIQATHDALTGLWNRGAVLDLLDRELARAGREDLPLSAVMMDLDHFKRINDTYGHAAGDAALREVVARLSSSLRPYDALGRYGGEEFLVAASHCQAAEAEDLAERLRGAVAQEPVRLAEEDLTVTLSLGVATWEPGMPMDADALLRAADAALGRAKGAGRNRVEVAVNESRQGKVKPEKRSRKRLRLVA